jgi:lipoate-protein ligase B
MVPYARALAWQERLVEERGRGGDDRLDLLEHPPVYTLGRGADATFLAAAAGGPVPVVRTSRGGQVTYHGPGQLVAYPVLDLRRHRCDVRWYVRRLEDVLIRTLATFGVEGERVAGAPGVWVAGAKIASIGIAVRRWITWHGLALNVDVDLTPFTRIVPCGLAGVRMTSLAGEGRSVGVVEAAAALTGAFARVFGYDTAVRLDVAPARGVDEARP